MLPSEQLHLGKTADDDPSLDSLEARSKLVEEQQKQIFSNFEDLDNLCFDFPSSPVENKLQAGDFQFKDDEKGSPFASLGIVKDLVSRSRKLNDQKTLVSNCSDEDPEANEKKLSTTAKIRIAGQQFIDSYSSKADEISQPNHPYAVSFSRLSDDEAEDIELLLTLLASAEKTDKKQFDHARKLVQLCSNMCLNEETPVERLVYYFSEAIHIKINHEMGIVARNELDSMQMFDLQEALMNVDTRIFAFHQKVPLSQVCQFSSIHTIINNLKKARKIHIIDLEIRTGMHYIVMMQAIENCREWHIDHIKITAIGTRLADFAKSMNIPFSFKIVMVADVLDFNIDLIELCDGEKVAVYAAFFLSYHIVKPNRLEYLMRVIRKINPCVMVIAEVEANHTSPVFVNRFIEALFFYGALFDSLSDCLVNDDLNRRAIESVFYGYCIRNIVAAEGDERTIRHTGLDVWRKFFKRFGMLEIELSDTALNEAKLLIDDFNCGNSCSLVVDGGCFLVGWKGVPVFSVSAWKFII
ncbi:hypothetical protein L2E82_06069 [Cichorium intybus]|uniref:Uncharacterized protein n=1 Tax=Cichorium intybus TaxID=13427 RepID=A0ACB9HA50_CICIN|nr:hypothetical protein L2E82_06069 [Cichorium intybus]